MIMRFVPKLIAGIWAPLLMVALVLANTQLGPLADRAKFANASTLGDVNGDGVINSIDAFFTLGLHAGIIPPPGHFNPKADVNEDGFVNSVDAILILQFHAGLLASLPPPN
jgi:hypothetical protein